MTVKALRVGVAALGAQDIDEDAVASLVVQSVDRSLENTVVIHARSIIAPKARMPLQTTRN
jgi:hypothetical protein